MQHSNNYDVLNRLPKDQLLLAANQGGLHARGGAGRPQQRNNSRSHQTSSKIDGTPYMATLRGFGLRESQKKSSGAGSGNNVTINGL